ncbi:MAG: SRPBCC family protein [Planctomycetaceae bacterium]|nr:SRPBCC family protein [Planctomycetaceae bacterium]
MRTIRCRAEIDAPRDALFALTQDYAARPRWDPVHGDVRLLDDGRVWYRSKDGMTMTVRYVSHDAPERVAMTMERGPFYFRRFSGAWVFKPLGDRRTEVTFNYSFELRWGLSVAEGFVARRLERTMNARLAGLKTHAESAG